MVLNKTLLILEDDLRTLSKLLEKLAQLEDDQPFSFSVIVMTNYLQVQELINKHPDFHLDIVLLDRDCKLAGSFHVLDLEKFGAEKVIAISSVPEYNEQAKKRGVKKVVEKNYAELDKFADQVVKEIESFVRPNWLHRVLGQNKKTVLSYR